LKKEHVDIIKLAEGNRSLLDLLNAWLERMPFFNDNQSWQDFAQPATSTVNPSLHPFWTEYRSQYSKSLAEAEKNNLEAFDEVFVIGNDEGRTISTTAAKSALFIMLYRGYPMLQLPFQLLNALLEIDEQLSSWRYRHMNMVHRMIGTRIGTGGSTGKDYLKAAADKHYTYREIARLTSFLIERRRLPSLPPSIERKLGFVDA
jgi:tryptophan 2,3-dioxygenase